MPSNVSQARKNITRRSAPSSSSAIRWRLGRRDPTRRKLVEKTRASTSTRTSTRIRANPWRPLPRHRRDILEHVGDEITHFVAGLGTSGTMMAPPDGCATQPQDRVRRGGSRPRRCTALGLKHMGSSIVPQMTTTPSCPTRSCRCDRGRLGHGRPDRTREGLHVRAQHGATWVGDALASRVRKGAW